MIFSPFPRAFRLVLLALVTALTTGLSLIGTPSLVILGYVGMYIVLALRNELILDTTKRTYIWRDGVWPLMGSRRGIFEDMRWVSIGTYDGGASGTPFVEYFVELVWTSPTGSAPHRVAKGLNFAVAAQTAAELAKAAGIPVVENAALRRLRPKLGPAPYDAQILIPVDDRPRSLAARLRR